MMKLIMLILLPLIAVCQTYTYCPECSITITPQWQELSPTHASESKQVIVGTLTFKKKIKDPIKLEKITLQWHGAPINHLCGSLYHNRSHKNFKAIEENVLCDSTWHNHTQQLALPFNEKKTLGIIDTLYLVLMIPKDNDHILRNGYFTIISEDLPSPFQKTAQTQQLNLAGR